MPKESNHRKYKDNVSKQSSKYDFEIDFEKKNDERKNKVAFKEALKILDEYVETHKKNPYCHKLPNDKKKCEDVEEECCCGCECAKCVVASCNICDVPEINKFLNTVYTTIPNFPFPNNSVLINLNGTTQDLPLQLGEFNYYVALPHDQECGEIRLLWPLVWIIRELINKLRGRFSGSGFVSIRFVLNVLSKKLIKDPAQAITTLNTDGITNGPCFCETANAAKFDYDFLFQFGPNIATPAVSELISASVRFSGPNVDNIITLHINPVTLALTLRIPPSLQLLEILSALGDIDLPFVGEIAYHSPAHYYSFIPSCGQDACDRYWVATSLELVHV